MALYCGMDLHSNNVWVVMLDGPTKVVKEVKLPTDLSAVLEVLEPYRADLAGIVVESTFNWYWLVDGLMEAGYRLHLANTWASKQWEGLKHADDRHDARLLGHLLALGILREGYIYPKHERPLRDMLRRRSFLVQTRTSLLLSMHGAFQCWTGMTAKDGDLDELTSEELAVLVGSEDSAYGISCLAGPVKVLSDTISEIEKRVLPKAKLRDEFRHLLSVWGIGKILALTIMYEVGDIKRFKAVGNYASYCRLVKSARLTNGKGKGRGNTKNGNPYLSWAYSEASHFAVQHYDRARRYFQRKRPKTNGVIANRALAHKLARASFYVMRDQVAFDPDKLFR